MARWPEFWIDYGYCVDCEDWRPGRAMIVATRAYVVKWLRGINISKLLRKRGYVWCPLIRSWCLDVKPAVPERIIAEVNWLMQHGFEPANEWFLPPRLWAEAVVMSVVPWRWGHDDSPKYSFRVSRQSYGLLIEPGLYSFEAESADEHEKREWARAIRDVKRKLEAKGLTVEEDVDKYGFIVLRVLIVPCKTDKNMEREEVVEA